MTLTASASLAGRLMQAPVVSYCSSCVKCETHNIDTFGMGKGCSCESADRGFSEQLLPPPYLVAPIIPALTDPPHWGIYLSWAPLLDPPSGYLPIRGSPSEPPPLVVILTSCTIYSQLTPLGVSRGQQVDPPSPPGYSSALSTRQIKGLGFSLDSGKPKGPFKNFALKKRSRKAREVHTEGKSYNCEIATIHSLGKKETYSCEICNKAFSVKSHVVSHMRVHAKEKPYSCEICKKDFSEKYTLVIQIRAHQKRSHTAATFAIKPSH
ncbi:zinc finger protein 287-like [Penaeus monodon]|uniref:zinc finger protein 287-like n=1 Tax=Penaeus monodon TaxID=6687 RepID=UPI0018A7358D|nr:zinc finger protein 287-like [Penaeus monodon]